jgi:putative membrane protein
MPNITETIDELPITTHGRKLHPLGLLVGFIAGLPQLIFPVLAISFGTRNAGGERTFIYVVAGALLISLLFRWLSWLRYRFHVGDDDIRIESGLFQRTARSIPYDRIHDVSIERKPLARLLGLSQVTFDTGGGKGDDDASLRYVSEAEAIALRDKVRGRKLEAADNNSDIASDIAKQVSIDPVFAMDRHRVLIMGMYAFSLIVVAVLGGLAQQLDFLLRFDFWDLNAWIDIAEDRGISIESFDRYSQTVGAIIALAGLLVLGIASGLIVTVLREYGFRLNRTSTGFRRQRGLLTQTDAVMSVGRIQAAIISTGPVRKRSGWYALNFVSLAQDSKENRNFAAAPFATMAEIERILAQTGIKAPDDQTHFVRGPIGPWVDVWVFAVVCVAVLILALKLTIGIFAYGLGVIPAVLIVLFTVQWRHQLHAINREQLFARHGWWREKMNIACQVNVQSVSISQGPLSRRRGLARLDFGIAGGHLGFASIPLAQAISIRDQIMEIIAPVDFSELGALNT